MKRDLSAPTIRQMITLQYLRGCNGQPHVTAMPIAKGHRLPAYACAKKGWVEVRGFATDPRFVLTDTGRAVEEKYRDKVHGRCDERGRLITK